MRAGHFLANGVGGKLNVRLAKVAGHFQKVRFAQGEAFLAMRAGNFLPEIASVKPDMHPAGGAGHFVELGGFGLAGQSPTPEHRRITAKQQI